MATNIPTSVVKVTIKVQNPSGLQGSFSNVLMMGPAPFAETFQEYASDTALTDMITAGFTPDHVGYRAMAKLLSSDPQPDKVYYGKRAHSFQQLTDLTATAITNLATYKVSVDGHEATYTADSSASANEVYTGIAAAITGLSAGVTATNVGDTKVRITTTASDTMVAITGLSKLTAKDATADASVVSDYLAVAEELEDFYYVTLASPSTAEKSAMVTQIQAEKHVFIFDVQDTEVFNSGVTNDILSTLAAGSFDRSALYFHRDNSQFLGIAAVGERAPYHPRTGDSWEYASPGGVTLDALTTTQLGVVLGKGGNVLRQIGDDNVIMEGKMLDGTWIDQRTGQDALEFDLNQAGWNAIKVPGGLAITNRSMDRVSNAIENVLKLYQQEGFLNPESEVSCTHPDASTISAADRKARKVKGFKFKAQLAERFGSLEIEGSIIL